MMDMVEEVKVEGIKAEESPRIQVFQIRREVCTCPICGQRHPKRKKTSQ